MIINHKKKYLFVHVPKNAGNAITAAIPGEHHESMKLSHGHVTLREILQINSVYTQYFSFAFVRNPFDRLYSLYQFNLPFVPRFKHRNDYLELGLNWYESCSFKQWLIEKDTWAGWDVDKERLPEQRATQTPYLIDGNNRIGVDYIGHFENIENDFKAVCSIIDVTTRLLKSNRSKREKDYMKMYDNEMIDFVVKHHQIDLDNFGYTI